MLNIIINIIEHNENRDFPPDWRRWLKVLIKLTQISSQTIIRCVKILLKIRISLNETLLEKLN